MPGCEEPDKILHGAATLECNQTVFIWGQSSKNLLRHIKKPLYFAGLAIEGGRLYRR